MQYSTTCFGRDAEVYIGREMQESLGEGGRSGLGELTKHEG